MRRPIDKWHARRTAICAAALMAFAAFAPTGCSNSTGSGTDSTTAAIAETSTEKPSEPKTEQNSETEKETEKETETMTEKETELVTKPTDDGIWCNPNIDISWIDPSKPMVAFAFDDGPTGTAETGNSMRILKALSDNGQHATFFYWGNSLKGNEGEIKKAFELGMEVGNHTWSHNDLTKLSDEECRDEIEKMRAALEEITGQKEFLIRAPYLSYNDKVMKIAGVPFANCGLDTKDWAGASTEEIENTIMTACENGTLSNRIILMHETQKNTVEAVEFLVPALMERGYQIVSVSEMFEANGVDMVDGKLYNNCPK